MEEGAPGQPLLLSQGTERVCPPESQPPGRRLADRDFFTHVAWQLDCRDPDSALRKGEGNGEGRDTRGKLSGWEAAALEVSSDPRKTGIEFQGRVRPAPLGCGRPLGLAAVRLCEVCGVGSAEDANELQTAGTPLAPGARNRVSQGS